MELLTSYERKGMEKGMEKGIKKGIEQGIKKVAMNLLSDGIAVQKVVELTGLAEQEIKELKVKQS